MGFWYFLMLVIGGMIVSVALIKHSKSNAAKWSKVFVGAGMMTVALFMFQDGSAEIVDSLLQSMNIRL